MNPTLRNYLARIGARGGAAGKGAAKRRTREQAQAAVRARWSRRAAAALSPSGPVSRENPTETTG